MADRDTSRARLGPEGVSDQDGEHLQEAFGVTTVADLADVKYVRWAQTLAALDTSAK